MKDGAKARMSDQQLILSYQQGDETAFATLYARYADKMISIAFAKIRDEQLAEDITQRVWIVFIEKLKEGNYQEQGKLENYLCLLVNRRVLDVIKSSDYKRQTRSIDVYESYDNFNQDDDTSFEGNLIMTSNDEQTRCMVEYYKNFLTGYTTSAQNIETGEKQSKVLRKFINKLPVDQRRTLILRYKFRYTFREVAEIMDKSQNTVQGFERYALQNIRKMMAKC